MRGKGDLGLHGKREGRKISANRKKGAVALLFFLGLLLCDGCGGGKSDYGVFLSVDRDEIGKLEGYRKVVVEPELFEESDIRALKEEGIEVYAYLNVGAVEEYRPYYQDYRQYGLGRYEDWPDEVWVDCSQSQWQSFVVDTLARRYADRGYDGFFIDNTDVYYHYPREDIYRGLVEILQGLKAHEKKVIINGGDRFVLRLIEDEGQLGIFDGVNQECVFTSIDFSSQSYGDQSKETQAYYMDYLERVKVVGKEVYLLEYGASADTRKRIKDYSEENGFHYFVSKDMNLVGAGR